MGFSPSFLGRVQAFDRALGRCFFRYLIGVAALYTLSFWLIYLWLPIPISSVMWKGANGVPVILACGFSFIGACLYPKGEELFGKDMVNWALYGGWFVAFSSYIVNILLWLLFQQDFPGIYLLSMAIGTIINLVVIGAVMGVMFLGIMYALQFGLLKKEGR